MKTKNIVLKQQLFSRLNAAILAVLLVSALSANAGENGAGAGPDYRLGSSAPAPADEKWVLLPTFSFSSLSGRPSWEEYDAQLFYKLNPNLTVGGEVDVRNRPPSGTDTLYSTMVSYTPWKPLELHAAITLSPNASFSPEQIYQVGFEVRPVSRISLLLDYQHYHYGSGSVDQIKPGITYWFSDETFFTARYAYGSAFGGTKFDGFGGRLNLGLPEKRRLILGYWHGTDPERDFGVPNTISLTGNTYSLYFQQPLKRNVDLIVGVEYETLNHSYNRTTGTIGLAIKF